MRFGVLEPGVETVKTLYLLNTGAIGDRTLDVSIRSQSVTQQPTSPTPQTPDNAGLRDVNETLQTLVVPTAQAIKLTSHVTYRRSSLPQPGLADLRMYGNDFWEDSVSGEATITSIFQCVASCGLKLESIQFESQVKCVRSTLPFTHNECSQEHTSARLIDCSLDNIEPEDTADGIWSLFSLVALIPTPTQTGLPGTSSQQSVVSQCRSLKVQGRISLLLGYTSFGGEGMFYACMHPPANAVSSSDRLLPNGEPGTPSTTKFTLPSLNPPTDDLIALLDLPSTGKLHVPMITKLTVRNSDTSRTAVVTVHLEPDPSDGFVVAGLRSGRLPMLLPETEATLCWKLIPVECGFAKVPKIKVIDRRKAIVPPGQEPLDPPPEPGSDAEGDVVKLVDVRWDGRTEGGDEIRATGDVGSILILP